MSKPLVFMLALSLTLSAHASRTLIDETGRKVTLPDHPHRIICLAPSITDTVYALGAGDDVVAISDYTRYPKDALSKPKVGILETISIETIVSMHPDLVIGIQTDGPVESTKVLERLGVTEYLVSPHRIAGIMQSTLSTGEALNRSKEAHALVTRLEARVAAVKARVAGKPTPSVLMPLWYDPIITIGKNAFITEIIADAGGRSITDDITADWPQVSMEAVIARAPQALLLNREGKTTLDVLKDRPGWSTIPAVKNRKAFYMDWRMELPSPIAIDALEDLAKQFHPES